MEQAFVDTSAWYAFVNQQDPDHARIRKLFRTFQGRLLSSNYIFDETITLCLYRLGHAVAVKVGETLRNPAVVGLLQVTPEDDQKAWTLFLERPDKMYSYTDCVSFTLMKKLHIEVAMALDEDFRQEGFRVVP